MVDKSISQLRFRAWKVAHLHEVLYLPVQLIPAPVEVAPGIMAGGWTDSRGYITVAVDRDKDKMVFILLHEILHHVLYHIQRGRKLGVFEDEKKKVVWNVAVDHVVNTMLRHLGLKVPEDAILFRNLPSGPAEAIYRRLLRENRVRWVRRGEFYVIDERWVVTVGRHQIEAPHGRFQLHQELRDRGTVPAGWLREFERVDERTDPLEALFQTVTAYIGRKAHGQTWSRVPIWSWGIRKRRGIRVPGTLKKWTSVAFAIDSSGSISRHELSRFISCCNKLLPKVDENWVLVVDAALWSVQHNVDKIEVVRGGGGTDFRPAFAWFRDHRVVPMAMLFFTDTWGKFPRWKPSWPVYWVVPEGLAASSRVPFGTLILI